jgi:hypothetical protein
VVPVAGEDPVAERATVEREPHVRAAIVDGVDLIAVGEQTQRVSVEVDHKPPRRTQLGKRRGPDQRFSGDGGGHLLLLDRGNAGQPRTSTMV